MVSMGAPAQSIGAAMESIGVPYIADKLVFVL